MFLNSLGLQFVMQSYPTYHALYVVSVRQTGDLPTTFLQIPRRRGHPWCLAMCLALSTRTWDFHPLDCAHAGRT